MWLFYFLIVKKDLFVKIQTKYQYTIGPGSGRIAIQSSKTKELMPARCGDIFSPSTQKADEVERIFEARLDFVV